MEASKKVKAFQIAVTSTLFENDEFIFITT